MFDGLWADARHAARQLAKRPAFALAAALTLALGIGANTALFSVVNGVLLRPLPYEAPDRLVTFRSNQSALDLDDVRAQAKTFVRLGGVVLQSLDDTTGAEPLPLRAGLVTDEFFATLGVPPARGRAIGPGDDTPGGRRVVVLSHPLWRDRYGADPQILGRPLVLGGDSYTVVGVMPPEFAAPRDPSEAWLPLHVASPAAAAARGVHFLQTYGRLAPDATLDQARAEMSLVDRRLAKAYPDENKDRRTALIPLHERVVGAARRTLLMLWGAAALVFAVACTNFGNLLFARGLDRQREIVVRGALGAPRSRLVRVLLLESLWLALIGGGAGVLIAFGGVDLLRAVKPQNLPRLDAIRVDHGALAFALGLSVLTALAFGAVPAWSASSPKLGPPLREGVRGATGSRRRQRLRRVLVVAEIAAALMLLAGAGLLVETLRNLRAVEPGFNPASLVTMRIDLPEARYGEIEAQARFRQEALASLDSTPGVRAAMVSELPLSGESLDHDFIIEGRPTLEPGDEPSIDSRSVEGDYFRVMQIPLVRGRDFTADDGIGKPLVGIVNESAARLHFAGEDPLGQRVRWARAEGPLEWITIVGIVGDVKHFGLDLPEEPAIYTPYAQSTRAWKRWMVVVARTHAPAAAVTGALKRQVWKVDPLLAPTHVRTMDDVAALSVSARRFSMTLLVLFAALAVALAAVGIYGVTSYGAAQRVREFGVRMALGAESRALLRLVLGEGARLAAGGLALGLAGALAATRLLRGLLYGVQPSDPVTLGVGAAIMGAVALSASLIPARRASRIDPMVALRDE